MVDNGDAEIRRALASMSRGRFVLTSAHDNKRSGVIVESAQAVGASPPLVCVACRKGHPISTIIRDGRHFGLSEIDGADRVLAKRFAFERPDRGDPFDLMEVAKLKSGCPILKRGIFALDCEVHRRIDLECECELYIGRVLAARVLRQDA